MFGLICDEQIFPNVFRFACNMLVSLTDALTKFYKAVFGYTLLFSSMDGL